ncbi:MAG: nitroreductase [Actinomycetota bacterium]|nr:nitroreductase [Actinomycetota bacterium]
MGAPDCFDDPARPANDEHTVLDRFDDLARSRRTSLLLDAERPVDDALVDRLCELATWAPNHHRTWPWRFAALTGDARARLGEACAEHLAGRGAPDAKIVKALGKYLRAPVMLLVASAHDDDPVVRAENRDAVAAGVQTLLLAATAAGLASFWGSGVVTEAPAVRELCGFGPDDQVVAAIYLGWPTGEVPVPERPAPVVHRP